MLNFNFIIHIPTEIKQKNKSNFIQVTSILIYTCFIL